MKTAKCPIGVFSFDENGELADYRLFSLNTEKAVEEFLSAQGTDADAQRLLRKRMREYAIDLRFISNHEELNQFISEFSLRLSRKRMKGLISMDKFLIQAFNSLEDLSATLNIFYERLKEWYTLHYPETRLSQRELAESILEHGNRKNFPGFTGSTGVELSDEDVKVLKDYAALIKDMSERKNALERYVKDVSRLIAPNFSSLIDALLAARFIALAGGLERLARLPASSIQLLGAEKALFRHLKKMGKAPKYGILYLDAHVQNAPAEKKGKIARILASKLMLAARIDFYSGRADEKLRIDLEKELKAVL